MATRTTSELDDLRDELAELRAELRQAVKAVANRRGGGGRASGLKAGLASHAARTATNVIADVLPKGAQVIRDPMERAIVAHPFAAAAVAIVGAVMLRRYIGLGRVAQAAVAAAPWKLP